jgi:hypothetical protein
LLFKYEDGRSAYLLPGDSQHDQYRAVVGFTRGIKHRAIMTSVRGKAELIMSNLLAEAIKKASMEEVQTLVVHN